MVVLPAFVFILIIPAIAIKATWDREQFSLKLINTPAWNQQKQEGSGSQFVYLVMITHEFPIAVNIFGVPLSAGLLASALVAPLGTVIFSLAQAYSGLR